MLFRRLIAACVVGVVACSMVVVAENADTPSGKWVARDNMPAAFELPAENRVRTSLFAYLPRLVLACKDESSLQAYFITGFDKPKGQELELQSVRLRFDDEREIEESLQEARPAGQLRFGDPDAFVYEALSHGQLSLNFEAFLYGRKQTRFDLTGLREVVDQLEPSCKAPLMAWLKLPGGDPQNPVVPEPRRVIEQLAENATPSADGAPAANGAVARNGAGEGAGENGSAENGATPEGVPGAPLEDGIEPTMRASMLPGDPEAEAVAENDSGEAPQPEEDAPAENEGSGDVPSGEDEEIAEPLTVGSTNPEIIPSRRVAPRYPADALRAGISGKVRLRVTITRKGRVSEVQSLENDDDEHGFVEAAREAVMKWRYLPATVNGKRVAQDINVTVEFRP